MNNLPNEDISIAQLKVLQQKVLMAESLNKKVLVLLQWLLFLFFRTRFG